MSHSQLMINKLKFLANRNLSIFLFAVFILINIYYFSHNFLNTFLNPGDNGDEHYHYRLYSILNFKLGDFFYVSSQPFIFLSSLVDSLLKSPRHSTRLISLIGSLILIFYFLRRIISNNSSRLENLYKSSLFICAIFITNQIFMGTPDFLSVVFVIPPFLLILENVKSKQIQISLKQSILAGLFFGLAVATRPTSIVLIFAFYLTLFLVSGIKPVISKWNLISLSTGAILLILLNFLPLIEQQKLILDVKEVPKETGVTWFQRNYLMAKYWDSNVRPTTQWVSTQEVIDFKKENPQFIFPKNQIDLLFMEPGLYTRQMIRMFLKALYSNYRFIYLLLPLLFLSFFIRKKQNILGRINRSYNKLFENKFIIVFHLISIILFSFLAVKLFEFRWVISTMILYSFFSLTYLSHFPQKIRFLVYNISFLSGIGMYILFYIRYF